MTPLAIRFQETECYSPVIDDYETTFMAISNVGTWFARTVAGEGSTLREKRKLFKAFVEQAVQKGRGPCEVRL